MTLISMIIYKQEIKQEKKHQFSQFSILPVEAGQLPMKYEHGRPSQWQGGPQQKVSAMLEI